MGSSIAIMKTSVRLHIDPVSFLFTGYPQNTEIKNLSQQSFDFLSEEHRNFEPNTPDSSKRMFRESSFEIFHDVNDRDVWIRLRLESSIRDSRGVRILFKEWNDFKYARFSVNFVKDLETSPTFTVGCLRCENKNTYKCRCKLVGPEPCFSGPLCSFAAFESFVVKPNETFEPLFIRAKISVEFFRQEQDPMQSIAEEVRKESQWELGKNILNEGLKGLYSDFTLECGGQLFPCHKIFLASQSNVFKAMFASQMSETAHNLMKVEDMTIETINAFLKFLYCGQLPVERMDLIFDLLKVGHKYEIQGLMSASSKVLVNGMIENFDISTALGMFAFFGGLTKYSDLRDKAVQILKLKSDQLVTSGEFRNLMMQHPQLVQNLFAKICAN